MSTGLPTNVISSFDSMVKQAYQASGVVRKTLRVKTGVVGSTHRFPKIGRGQATPRLPQTDVVPMGIAHTSATATLTDWNAAEYTDVFNQAKVNYSEQQALATVIASAIGRREDQLAIDAMDAAGTSLTVGTNIGGTSTNYNTAKAREWKKLLDAKNVPSDSRYYLGHTNNLHGLLGDATATSSDFNTIHALVNGTLDTWLGAKHIWIGDYDEGGLALAGSVRKNFAYHQTAVGLAVGIDQRTEVNYIPEKTSWLANGLFSAGVAVIDSEGLVELDCTES